MTQRTFDPGTADHGTADWFAATSWAPEGIPASGDVLTIGTGDAVISSADVTADGERVLLGSTLASAPAILSADGARFGSTFAIDVGGSADQAALAFSGAVSDRGNITVAKGAHLDVNGGTFADDGTISLAGAMTLGAGTTLAGTGTILVDPGATLVVDGPVLPGPTIEFSGKGGTVELGNPGAFQGSVADLTKFDDLELQHTLAGLAGYDGKTDVVTIRQSVTNSVVLAQFTLTGVFTGPELYVGPNGKAQSRLTQSVPRTWNGGTGDWYTASNWSSPAKFINSYPRFGDNATIASGTAEVSATDVTAHPTLDNELIKLGGTSNGAKPTLSLAGGSLGPNLQIETQGTNTEATILAQGTVTSSATISSAAIDGRLRIDVAGTASGFVNAVTGNIATGSESALEIAGGNVTNEGLIIVGGGHGTIDAGAAVTGAGAIQILEGGTLLVDGSIASAQQVQFESGDTLQDVLEIGSGASMEATIADFLQGDTIELLGAVANYASFDKTTGILALRDGGAGGTQVASLHLSGQYGAHDFHVSSDKAGDSFITDTASAATTLTDVLPVELALPLSGQMNLASILQEAFGSNLIGFNSVTISSTSASELFNRRFSYWDPQNPAVSSWTVNGTALPADDPVQVSSGDFGNVDFVAGDDIRADATITVATAFGASGSPREYTQYVVRTDIPSLASGTAASGTPTARDIVNEARLYASTYSPPPPNDNDCYNIAGDVAGAAGASIINDGDFNPNKNAAGGFWRIAYNGALSNNVGTNWPKLLRAGDIVRMAWQKTAGSGHSTTVLTTPTLDAGGTYEFTVYDNADHDTIGIHSAHYQTAARSNSISVFRLDPGQLYLVTGGTTAAAFIQGSAYANLILPIGNADTILAGTADNIIADTAAVLDDAQLLDFHAGDTVDITNLDPAAATTSYDVETGVLTVQSPGTTVTLDLPAGLQGNFTVSSDGGTMTGRPADGGQVPPGVTLRALDGGDLGTLYTDLGSATGSFIEMVPDVIYALSDATVQAGSGAETVFAGPAGGDTVYGGSGALTFINGGGASTLFGGTGAVTLFGGSGGLYFGGTGGNNLLVAGSGAATLVGGGAGDQLYAAGSANDMLVAGSGNETLSGYGSTGAEVYFGGSGPDVMVAGSGTSFIEAGSGADTIFAGSGAAAVFAGPGQDLIVGGTGPGFVRFGAGSATVFAGTGGSIFSAVNGMAGGADVIVGFTARDRISLTGYATGPTTATANGSTTLALADGTHITVVGVAHLPANAFV